MLYHNKITIKGIKCMINKEWKNIRILDMGKLFIIYLA